MKKYRLLTKSDFDGLLSAAILKEAGLIDDVTFVNSFDFEKGLVKADENVITCNLPYSNKVSLSFDYGLNPRATNHVTDIEAESSSSMVYEYFNKQLNESDDKKIKELLETAKKSNLALYSMEEVVNPKSSNLLSFLLDSRTGIGRVRAFRISNYALMVHLVDLLLNKSIDELLELPDIKERSDYYFQSQENYKEMLDYVSKMEDDILILDLREETYVRPANRFIKYAFNPKAKFSIQLMWGLKQKNTVFAIGKTIFGRDENVDLREVLAPFSAICRKNSGTVQVDNDKADECLNNIVKALKEASHEKQDLWGDSN